MRLSNHMTHPERAAQNMQRYAILAELQRRPGFSMCAFCKHGVSGWGRHACSRMGRSYPECDTQPGISFEPDTTKTPKV